VIVGAHVIVGQYLVVVHMLRPVTNATKSIVSVSNYVDKLSSIFMNIGRSTPRHQAIAMLYPHSKKLQAYISEYFIVVVRLCHCLFSFGQKSGFKQFTSSLSDADLMAYQSDLQNWASTIEKEMQVSEAQESAGFRALSRSKFNLASHQQKLASRNRVLDFCSTYDHVIIWKQTRKAGNTSLYTNFVEYQEWRDSSCPCTLVFTGKLGSGKSVLLANIVDDLSLSTKRDQPVVAYFFVRHDVPESLQARTILGSLARQFLGTVRDLDTLSDSFGDTHTTGDVDKLVEMLRHGYPSDKRTYFVIDGLDECAVNEREILVQAVQKIQEKLYVLVCTSFRVEPNRGLQSTTNHLSATRIIPLPENNPDIEVFIEADLERCLSQELLAVGDPTLILDIHDTLLKGSQGMFLWVALQIQSLCSMKTDHAIREALADLPRDLPQTYARILRQSGSSDPSLQAKTLQLVLAAYRLLTTEELREALSVTPGDATWNPSKRLNDVQSALACCGCLLTVDEEDLTVRVMHHSVEQYILRGADSVAHMGFPIEDARTTMADIVVTYLNYDVFETQLSRVKTRPIMAQSAPSTIMQSAIGNSSTARQFAMKLLKSRKQTAFDLSKTVAEVRGYSEAQREDVFKLYAYAETYLQNHILYASGQDDSIYKLSAKLIQGRMSEIEKLNANFWLLWRSAAGRGNMNILELLFEAGKIDVNAKDYSGFAPIFRSAMEGEKDVVELLLRSERIDVDWKDVRGMTAFMEAADAGHRDIVKLLINTGKVDSSLTNNQGRTALMMAAVNGHKDVVKLLLATGNGDKNAKDSKGQTALSLAQMMGHRGIVKLLTPL
jgi:ankyrin repeat protein